MPRALVHFPNIPMNAIESLRQQYDPTASLIRAHITIVFPTPATVTESHLLDHTRGASSPAGSRSTSASTASTRSWDQWLFLTLEDGNADVIRLYRDLYTGPLAQYCSEDIEFMPHVSLGMFARRGEEYELRDPTAVRGDDARYAAALAEAEALGIDYRCTLDRLMPVTPTDDFSRADLGPDLR